MTWLTAMEYMCHKWPRHVSLVVNTSRFFPHSWFTTGVVTRLTWRVPLMEQELYTLLEHLISPPVFSGVRVTRSFVLCVCFLDRCFALCPFSLLAIVLSVLRRYTNSDYLFGIFIFFILLALTVHIDSPRMIVVFILISIVCSV